MGEKSNHHSRSDIDNYSQTSLDKFFGRYICYCASEHSLPSKYKQGNLSSANECFVDEYKTDMSRSNSVNIISITLHKSVSAYLVQTGCKVLQLLQLKLQHLLLLICTYV